MAKEGNAGFEIPADMRALAERVSSRPSRHLIFSFQRLNTQSAPLRIRAGAKEVGELAVNFAERNIASSFELHRSCCGPKTLRTSWHCTRSM